MADEKNLVLGESPELGEIIIAPEVIEVIIGIAASKVDGVYGMRGSLASNVTELLGKAAHGKGVYLKNDEDGLKQQVLFMTDVALSEVNIHVVGVVAEKLEQPTLEELFNDEEENNE